MRGKLVASLLPWTIAASLLRCGSSDSHATWTAGMDSTEVRTIEVGSSTCTDCILLTEAAVLGDLEGPGYVEETSNVIRDGLGNYWVAQNSEIKLFDSTGRFMRTLGRAGGGPGEFGSVGPMFVDADGRTHVFDRGNSRETIFTQDSQIHAEYRLPGFIRSAAPLAGGKMYVANVSLETADRVGLYLHIVKASEIIHSFGRPVGEGTVTPFESRRVLATDGAGRVYSAPYHAYRIEVWTADGRRITSLAGPTLNQRQPLPGPWSPENPPANQIVAIRVDDAERLWVVRSALNDDWRSNMVEEVRPDGRTMYRPADDRATSIYHSRIDVIDLRRGVMIASSVSSELLLTFAADGLLVGGRYHDDGFPQMVVWHATLNDPRER